jgi:hypothetical protein
MPLIRPIFNCICKAFRLKKTEHKGVIFRKEMIIQGRFFFLGMELDFY